jgi:hypothetical protein
MFAAITPVDNGGPLEEAARLSANAPFNASRILMKDAVGNFAVVASILNQQSASWAVSQALEEISPEADKAIRSWADSNEYGYCYDPAEVGALIHVLLTKPINPINWPGGSERPISFQTLFVANQDLEPVAALNKHLAAPAVIQAPPAGTMQIWKFIWRTLDA